MKKMAAIALSAMAIGATNVAAHHSAAEYGGAKTKITGVVKSWEWQNPHTFLQLTVTDAKGKPVEAGFEFGSPNTLIRNGFKVNSFKPGDKATITYTPRRDGRPGGGAEAVYSYTEKKWLQWGPGADVKAAKEAAAKRAAAKAAAGK